MTGAATPSRKPVPLTRILEALRERGLLVATSADLPEAITDLVDDSRRVSAGGGFVAVRGHAQDGHDWLESAVRAGASFAIVEDPSRIAADAAQPLPHAVVRNGREAAATAAAAFHGWPARELRIVGVTGTNGKTTTVGLLRHLLDEPDARAASIGTLGVLLGSEGTIVPGGSGLTTPGPVELQRVLAGLLAQGVRTVAMEVSSHSLDQRRVDGLEFAAAVFTNLTRDHLDYHGTMEEYRRAKLRLLGLLARDGTAVFNADDEAWAGGAATGARTIYFGRNPDADVSARDVHFGARGVAFQLVTPRGAAAVALPLIGDFNVANALGAATAAWALGMPIDVIAARLASAPQVPGRLEILTTSPTVLRDYAHTPDALERALQAVRPFARSDEGARLIALFGCGGDRDRGKRPEMGRIAESLADIVIVTSDNPRTEDPERILDDIEAGMKGREHLRIVDRHEAIARALAMAAPHDVVILAGKGHETYQIRGTVSYPFDEREIVHELMRDRVPA